MSGDSVIGQAFGEALFDALDRQWDRGAIREYARANDWERRVDQLVSLFEETCAAAAHPRATRERHRVVRNSPPGSQGDAG